MKFIIILIFLVVVNHVKSDETSSPITTPSLESALNSSSLSTSTWLPHPIIISPSAFISSTTLPNPSSVVVNISESSTVPPFRTMTLASSTLQSSVAPLLPFIQNSTNEEDLLKHSTERRDIHDKQEELKNGGVYLPGFSLYLIGFSMLLMFLIIMYLIFTLQKMKANGVSYQPFKRQDSSVSGKIDLNRQTSGERNAVIKLETIPTIECEGVKVEESFFSPTCVRDLNQNANSTSTLNKYETKISPLIRTHQHPDYLGPEKMRMICREALAKKLQTNSGNKDLTVLLKEIDDIERRPNNYNKNLVREKSASTPQLDIMDVYDTLPTPIPTSEVNEAKVLDESSSIPEVNNEDKSYLIAEIDKVDKPYSNAEVDKIEKSSSIGEVNIINKQSSVAEIDKIGDNRSSKYNDEDEYDDIPLYDSPPAASLNKRIIEDSQYLFPICTKPNNPSLDPSYINARKSNFIL